MGTTVAARSKPLSPTAGSMKKAIPAALLVLVSMRLEATVVETPAATEAEVAPAHVAESTTIRSVVGSRHVARTTPPIYPKAWATPVSANPNMLRRPESIHPQVVSTGIRRNEIRVVRIRVAPIVGGIVLLPVRRIVLLPIVGIVLLTVRRIVLLRIGRGRIGRSLASPLRTGVDLRLG